MNIEQTFGLCVLMTGAAFGLAVIYRECTNDAGLWKLARLLGLLGFMCWLCFGYHAVKECQIAYRAVAHWQQLAAVQGSGVGVFASHREIQTPGGGRLEWERTSAGTTSRPVFRAAERIGRGGSGTGCCDSACSGASGGIDCLRGGEQSGPDGIEGGKRL